SPSGAADITPPILVWRPRSRFLSVSPRARRPSVYSLARRSTSSRSGEAGKGITAPDTRLGRAGAVRLLPAALPVPGGTCGDGGHGAAAPPRSRPQQPPVRSAAAPPGLRARTGARRLPGPAAGRPDHGNPLLRAEHADAA